MVDLPRWIKSPFFIVIIGILPLLALAIISPSFESDFVWILAITWFFVVFILAELLAKKNEESGSTSTKEELDSTNDAQIDPTSKM